MRPTEFLQHRVIVIVIIVTPILWNPQLLSEKQVFSRWKSNRGKTFTTDEPKTKDLHYNFQATKAGWTIIWERTPNMMWKHIQNRALAILTDIIQFQENHIGAEHAGAQS